MKTLLLASCVSWNEDFLMYISKPELALVKFQLKDCDHSHERVGQNTIPFTSITQGKQHQFFLFSFTCSSSLVPFKLLSKFSKRFSETYICLKF